VFINRGIYSVILIFLFFCLSGGPLVQPCLVLEYNEMCSFTGQILEGCYISHERSIHWTREEGNSQVWNFWIGIQDLFRMRM
jgi:hypothetical protein